MRYEFLKPRSSFIDTLYKMRGHVLIFLKKPLKLTNALFLQWHFQNGINVSKILLFECESVWVLKVSILKSNEGETLGEKSFLVLVSKSISITPGIVAPSLQFLHSILLLLIFLIGLFCNCENFWQPAFHGLTHFAMPWIRFDYF